MDGPLAQRLVNDFLERRAVALGVAGLPVVVAAVRAIHRGWIPMGDNAYYALRARDVFTDHNPLVGAWSSGSSGSGVDVNNLGPLQLDLLAIPIRVFGFGAGTILAVAAINLASIAVVVLLARRSYGVPGMWVGAATTTVLSWSLGSELLIEPRTHHALLLPLLAALVSAAAVAAGDSAAVVPLVLSTTLVAQSHLTFVLPALVVAAVAGGLAVRGARGRPGWTGALLVGSLVLVLCWAQTIYEELRPGRGNLSATWEARGADRPAFGVEPGGASNHRRGAPTRRLVASVPPCVRSGRSAAGPRRCTGGAGRPRRRTRRARHPRPAGRRSGRSRLRRGGGHRAGRGGGRLGAGAHRRSLRRRLRQLPVPVAHRRLHHRRGRARRAPTTGPPGAGRMGGRGGDRGRGVGGSAHVLPVAGPTSRRAAAPRRPGPLRPGCGRRAVRSGRVRAGRALLR